MAGAGLPPREAGLAAAISICISIHILVHESTLKSAHVVGKSQHPAEQLVPLYWHVLVSYILL